MRIEKLARNISNNPFLRKIFRTPLGRWLFFFPSYVGYLLFNKNDMIPPPHKNFIGRGNFEGVGKEFFQYFSTFGAIKPDDRILDVGCGIGRMALPFVSFLSGKGEYCGFDVAKSGIEWCRKKISSRRSNFKFVHADIFNQLYNPKGHIQPQDFTFPYPDGYFDFVFLTSVFTHMGPEDISRYLGEINRVLKKDARAFITLNLLNEESIKNIENGKSYLKFIYTKNGHRSINKTNFNDDIAIDESWFLQHLSGNSLALVEPVHYGWWSGRNNGLSCQDIVIVRK